MTPRGRPGDARRGAVRFRAWTAPIERIGGSPQGRSFPGFFNFGPLALALPGVARVVAWGRPAPAHGSPAGGFDVCCGNGAALTVALARVPPEVAVATPFMADLASVDVSPPGKGARDFGPHDLESALALVAMVCAGDG